jgi:hypothetical protein
LTRFLFDVKKDIDRDGNCTYRPFFDAKGHPISVIRPAEMFGADLWRFGDKWVASEREAPIRARVDFSASRLAPDLRAVGKVPPPRHAEIHGWPLEKEARRSRARELGRELAADRQATRVAFPPAD